MFAHAITTTKHEIDDMNAIDVENGEPPRVRLRVRATAAAFMPKLNKMADFPQTAVLEETV